MNSDKRIDFIIDYMSSYQTKIKLANSKGLFDSAKMFELFAQEICKIYFEQKFNNLNDTKPNFPYFDLISEDESIYIQVSTISYMPNKISSTLKKIRDDKSGEFIKIRNAYFFMLSNESESKVKDYIGKNIIGNISFKKDNNLITTNKIINKAMSDLEFQEKLYTMLKTEFESFNNNYERFLQEIEISKEIGLKNIQTNINNEYEINRDYLINKIISDDEKFVMIQGVAGSGKSALCKKITDKYELVLFARAEKIVESNHINDIWNLNVEEILDLLNEKKIIFFIDALEFIADAPKTKLDILENLYYIVQKHKNCSIITSCRTNDVSAFIRLKSNYLIKEYFLDELNNIDLNYISKKYEIIEKISKNNNYNELLKTPFYINLIITNSIDVSNITDAASLRIYIWNNIICLKNKANDYNIKYNDIITEINKIVFKRAQNFILGIKKEEIDNSILNALLSENVIVENSQGIRLKYDIYEDICFENYFDEQFEKCKGNYIDFYNSIEEIGRCIYRRYQIWISNKLFIMDNNEKLLYNLIFSNNISSKWKNETEIGIVLSNYCEKFFEEYKNELIEHNLIKEFLDIVNLHCYIPEIKYMKSNLPLLILNPVGSGRKSLIKIIHENNIYKQNKLNSRDIIKLCFDFSKQSITDEDTSKRVCEMIEYYIDDVMINDNNYQIINSLELPLNVVFKLSTYSKDWLLKFINHLDSNLKSDDIRQYRNSKDIINWIIKNAYRELIYECSTELCSLINELWVVNNFSINKHYCYSYDNSLELQYGLSEESSNYHFDYKNVTENVFLYNLYRVDFKQGLNWSIEFINKAIEKYFENSPENIQKIDVRLKDDDFKQYYGNFDMWLAGILDHSVPTIIGDIIFILKNEVIRILNEIRTSKDIFKSFAEYVKQTIYTKSNNVVLLTIIESIAFKFEKELPGYGLELASNINILLWDINRYTLYIRNPVKENLEKNMLKILGITHLDKRYELNKDNGISIQSYVAHLQIYFDDNIKGECYKLLDYLYSITKNEGETASHYLQIQKMDFRNCKITKVDDVTYELEPEINGEAEQIVIKNEPQLKIEQNIIEKIEHYKTNSENGIVKLGDLESIVNDLISVCKDENLRLTYENILITAIAASLQEPTINKTKREKYCLIWIDGINNILRNETFNVESSLFVFLLNQINENINKKVKNNIKEIILKIIINNNNGLINEYMQITRTFLQQNQELAKSLFYTIIELSRNKFIYKKYSASYSKKTGGKNYDYQVNKIILKYLYQESILEIVSWNIDDYDISLLCNIFNCGIKFSNVEFNKFASLLINYIISIKNSMSDSYKIFNAYKDRILVDFFHREMISSAELSTEIIDLLFDNIHFENFSEDSIELYYEIFSNFSCEFYDSYKNDEKRKLCQKKIKYIEKKVNNISSESIRKKLFKILFFYPWRALWNPNDCITKYSYNDKLFIVEQLSNYGKFYLKDAILTIYQLNIIKLLPEILIAIMKIFEYETDDSKLENQLKGDTKTIINLIITTAFVRNNEEIKKDNDLINAYESILNRLIQLKYENASVLLNEFRIH